MTAPEPSPGQAAYEAHAGKMGGRRDAWGELPATYRDAWEAAAQAAVRATPLYAELAKQLAEAVAAQAPQAAPRADADRLLDWAARLITTAPEEADVLSAPWRSEQQDWLSAFKATPRARARQGLRDLADVHDALLEEILRNAGEDMDLTGTPEDRAARYVRSLEAGRTQERPAPGAVPDLLPGRMDKLDRIAGMCRRPAEVAGRSSGSGIVSGTNLAAAILHVIEEES